MLRDLIRSLPRARAHKGAQAEVREASLHEQGSYLLVFVSFVQAPPARPCDCMREQRVSEGQARSCSGLNKPTGLGVGVRAGPPTPYP